MKGTIYGLFCLEDRRAAGTEWGDSDNRFGSTIFLVLMSSDCREYIACVGNIQTRIFS
jgi:hypothetical protein